MSFFDFFWKSAIWKVLRIKFPFTLLGKAYWWLDSQLKEKAVNIRCYFLRKKAYSLFCEQKPYNFGTILISLTTYPARINSVYLAIYSILNQTIKPNKIILTLIKEEFPNGEANLPKNLLSLKKKGLEILWASDNLRPHNKYFYSMQKFHKALIITIDDDILYPSNTIEKLIKCYRKFPKAISALHTDKFFYNNNRLGDYSKAIIGYTNEINIPKFDLLAEGFAGVLYPPSILPPETFNKDLIQRCAPIADDIWLKCIELKYNIPVVCANAKHHVTVLTKYQTNALFIQNREKNLNDKQLEATQEALKIKIQPNNQCQIQIH